VSSPLFPITRTAPRRLGEALVARAAEGSRPAVAPAAAPSPVTPWIPRPAAAAVADAIAAAGQPPADLHATLEEARAKAIAEGRAEGLRETEAARERLAVAIAAVEVSRENSVTDTAAVIAEIATAVVESWLGAVPAADRMRPIVEGWLAGTTAPAVAYVNPADAEMLRSVVGEAAIEVETDAAVLRGDVIVRGAAFELRLDWAERLGELKELVAAAVSGAPADDGEVTP
jgi:flagellar biosynthesis/type III secretory pathway protein FliH